MFQEVEHLICKYVAFNPVQHLILLLVRCAGKKFTSFVRICFHERRFQYIEKEQLTQWHQLRPNEKIIEVRH